MLVFCINYILALKSVVSRTVGNVPTSPPSTSNSELFPSDSIGYSFQNEIISNNLNEFMSPPSSSTTLAAKRSFEFVKSAETFDEVDSTNDPSPTVFASKRVGFSHTETINLIRGINRFGIGNWTKILKCPQLFFHEKRNGTSLKNKYIALKNKLLQIRSDQKRYILYQRLHVSVWNQVLNQYLVKI